MKHVLLFFLVPVITWSQGPNTWEKKADFPGFKREQAVAFSVLDKGYIATGIDTSETVLNDLWEYEHITDTWTQKANVPGPGRRNAIAFATSTKGYVGLGIDNDEALTGNKLSDLHEYDPLTNAWTSKANYPGGGGFGMYYGTAFGLDNKGYVCGGKIGPSAYLNELWEYKPTIDQWAQRASFPGGIRYNLTSVAANGVAFVGLGTNQDSYTHDWWKYQPGTNTWEQETDFIGGDRAGVCSFALNNQIYVTLGTNGGLKDDLFIYHPATKQWHPRAYYGGSERKQAVAFVVGNSAYVGTGSGVSGKKVSMYQYFPDEFLTLDEITETVQVYPNPAKGTVQFSGNANAANYEILSLLGQVVAKGEVLASSQIDISYLPQGNYFFSLFTKEGNEIGQTPLIIAP